MNKSSRVQIKNVQYKSNNTQVAMHELEDVVVELQFFDRQTKTPVLVCALLDGSNGTKVAQILQTEINNEFPKHSFSSYSDEEARNTLANFLVNFDSFYLEQCQRQLVPVRETFRNLISQNEENISERFKQLDDVESQLRCACSVAIALYFDNKLFVANVGTCHAVLCGDNLSRPYKVLTREHSQLNDSECERLQKCGVSPEARRRMNENVFSGYTRCLGDYTMKREYRNLDYLSNVHSSPIIAEPFVSGPEQMLPNWNFLLFLSSGVCHLVLESVYDREKVEGEFLAKFLRRLNLESNTRRGSKPSVLPTSTAPGDVDLCVVAQRTLQDFITQHEMSIFASSELEQVGSAPASAVEGPPHHPLALPNELLLPTVAFPGTPASFSPKLSNRSRGTSTESHELQSRGLSPAGSVAQDEIQGQFEDLTLMIISFPTQSSSAPINEVRRGSVSPELVDVNNLRIDTSMEMEAVQVPQSIEDGSESTFTPLGSATDSSEPPGPIQAYVNFKFWNAAFASMNEDDMNLIKALLKPDAIDEESASEGLDDVVSQLSID